MALDQLGAQVVDGADEQPGVGHGGSRPGLLRQAEIREVRVAAIGRQEHVRSFDVAMDEPAVVSCVQRACNLRDERNGESRLDRPLRRDERAEVGSVDVAHRHVQLAVRLTRSVDRDDVRVLERCRQPRLAHEPVAEAVILGKIG